MQDIEIMSTCIFYLFPNLPKELRLQIWSFAKLNLLPTVVSVGLKSDSEERDLCFVVGIYNFNTFLSISRETRESIIGRYTTPISSAIDQNEGRIRVLEPHEQSGCDVQSLLVNMSQDLLFLSTVPETGGIDSSGPFGFHHILHTLFPK
jgi:hypothetical protein